MVIALPHCKVSGASLESAFIQAALGQIAASLSALSRTADNLDTMAKREGSQAKQEKGQLRVQKFRADYLDLKTQFDALKAEEANQVSHRTR